MTTHSHLPCGGIGEEKIPSSALIPCLLWQVGERAGPAPHWLQQLEKQGGHTHHLAKTVDLALVV